MNYESSYKYVYQMILIEIRIRKLIVICIHMCLVNVLILFLQLLINLYFIVGFYFITVIVFYLNCLFICFVCVHVGGIVYLGIKWPYETSCHGL